MRNRLRSLLISAAIVVTAAATLLAHHSVPGQFDISKPVTLKGVISKVDWINPHIYVHLDVKEPDGTTNTWALATLPTAMMRRAGITKESLQGKSGEEVTINAVPARDGSKHLAWINRSPTRTATRSRHTGQ
jgi:hypothetical protein